MTKKKIAKRTKEAVRKRKAPKKKRLALTKQPKQNRRGRPDLTQDQLPLDREEMVTLIIKCSGLVKYIALALRVSRQTVYTWMDIFPWIMDAMKDAREDTLDLAEHSVTKNIRARKEYTTTWYLDRIGRHRGFLPKQAILHTKNQFEEFDDSQLDKRITEEQDRLALCNAGETKKTKHK